MTAATPRGLYAIELRSPATCASGAPWPSRDGLARVVLAEVDRLADVRVGLGPRLRALPQGQSGEGQAPLAQDRRRLHEDLGAPLSRAGAPFTGGVPTSRDRIVNVVRICLGCRSHNAFWLAGIG